MGIFTYDPADGKGAESPLREGRIAIASLLVFVAMVLLGAYTGSRWPSLVGIAAWFMMMIFGTSVLDRADRRRKEKTWQRLEEQYEQNLEIRRRMGIEDHEP